MDWVKRNFDPRGRTSRLGYWRFQLLIALVLVPSWILAILAARANLPFIAAALLIIFLVVYLTTQLLIYVRRIHDRNRSAVWLFVFLVSPFALSCFDYAVHEHVQGNELFVLGTNLLGVVLGLWGLIELGFLRGTRGPNRFGAEPER